MPTMRTLYRRRSRIEAHMTIRLSVLLLALAVEGASAQLTGPERACQVGRGRAVYAMIAAEAACIRRCHARDAAGCTPPDGAGVARCLAKAKSHARRTLFTAPCRRDCPECWGGCGDDVATGEVDYSSGLVESFAS